MAVSANASSWRGAAVGDWFACLSLANLYCLNVWLELANTGFDYFRRSRPSAIAIWSLLVLILLGATGFWVFVQAGRRLNGRSARWAAVVGIPIGLLVPFQVLRHHLFAGALDRLEDVAGGTSVRISLAMVAVAFVIWLVARTQEVVQYLRAALITLLPLLPILAVQTAYVQVQRPEQSIYSGNVQQVPGGTTRTRLVIMVFDEWDQRLAFERRPARVELPFVDGLREQAFVASRAIGGGYLGVTSSIASMLTGQRLGSVEPRGIGVTPDGDRLVRTDAAASWVDSPTIFSELRRRGLSTSIVGWYIPYCRVLAEWVQDCSWEPGASIYSRPEFLREPSLVENARMFARRQASQLPFTDQLTLDSIEDERRILLGQELERIEAEFEASFDAADVVYAHWPIPHPLGLPGAAATPDQPANYLDNLRAVDALLARFGERLVREQRWDDVTLVLTSDHSFRPGHWDDTAAWTDEEEQATEGGRRFPHVPFIVKFAGRHAPLEFDQPFSIAMMYDVVLAIADEQVVSPAELGAWLDAHRHRHPTELGE